ncbi:MAG: Bax inhibitor-1/YccA family protein [Clostridiales bacterium]|nr:Bax inhibitor-1/YccA family protein [Clostridiales bacterium]
MFNQQENVVEMNGGLSAYVTKVFMWMFFGLIITAGVSYLTAATGLYTIFLTNMAMLLVLFIVEIGLVIYISTRISKGNISSKGAIIAFLVYAIINGLVLSSLFLAFQIGVLYQAFFMTAITFGTMAVYGYVTKKDLTRIGTLLVVGLLGIIIATIVNGIFGIFGMGSTGLDLVISYVAIAIFLGLAAWDTQKIKYYYYESLGNEGIQNNLAIYSALQLYLDFINLFLYILRIFASNRD